MSAVIPSWREGKLRTPEAVSPNWACRLLRIPDNLEFLAAIFGRLGDLVDPNEWDGREGIPEEDAAQYIAEMLLGAEVNYCMIGDIFPTARGTLRDNELYCHGQVLQRNDYPKLWDAIHPYLRHELTQTMRLPDLRGRVIVGVNYEPNEDYDQLSLEFNQEAGEQTVSIGVDGMPAHTHIANPHTHTDAGHTHTVPNVIINIDVEAPGVPDPIAAGLAPPTSSGVGYAALSSETVTLQETGQGLPHNNIQPSLGLNYVIVVK